MLDRETIVGKEVGRLDKGTVPYCDDFLTCLTRAKEVAHDEDFLRCLDKAICFSG